MQYGMGRVGGLAYRGNRNALVSRSASYFTPGPVNTWMGDCLWGDTSSQTLGM